MQTLGRHLLIEYYECDELLLADKERVRGILLEAARRARATIVTDVFHEFSPHGVSGVVVIAESHLAIHTWPEYGYAAVDVFTCNERLDRGVIQEFLKEKFRAGRTSSLDIQRGLGVGRPVVADPLGARIELVGIPRCQL